MAKRLNCIVVCFDTLRYDAVFGEDVETPHLDRLASRSVVFDNAWGEGEPTIPFRRAVMTGRRAFPWRYHLGDRGSSPNILGWHAIPEDQTTLAERLFRRGYLTGLVTDVWHMFKPTMNFHRGFVSWDFVRGQEADTQVVLPENRLAPATPGRGPDGVVPPGLMAYAMQVQERKNEEDYFVAQVFERASRWVDTNRDNGPFFLWVDSFSPHEFWDPPPAFADAYYKDPEVPDYIQPQILNTKEPSEAEIERTRALYRGYVTFCDRWFGRFLARLEALNVLEDTVLMVLSDHGTELWDKGRFGKSEARLHPYNTQINWILHHPEITAGRRLDAFVQNQDVAPTILEALGVGHPPLDGESVWPLVRGQKSRLRDAVITGWGRHAAVRDERWNLIVDTLNPSSLSLFDHRCDPKECVDVKEAHPQVVERLLARLEGLLGSPLPAVYQHRPQKGSAATYRELKQIRQRLGL